MKPIKRDQLADFLKNYFGAELIEKARKIDEYMANGLQWEGKEEIKKLVLGVSANEEFFKKALLVKADALLVHHGLALDTPYNLFSLSLQKRLKILTEYNLSLFAFHYLLDFHPVVGHNAQILKKLGAERLEITLHGDWGWVGEFKKARSVSEIFKQCQRLFNSKILIVGDSEKKVKRIGVVSGRGVPLALEKLELIEKKIELYLTGEISEWTPAEFKELGIVCLACGHYATERLGVMALGEVIKKAFPNLEVEFIDIDNQL